MIRERGAEFLSETLMINTALTFLDLRGDEIDLPRTTHNKNNNKNEQKTYYLTMELVQ